MAAVILMGFALSGCGSQSTSGGLSVGQEATVRGLCTSDGLNEGSCKCLLNSLGSRFSGQELTQFVEGIGRSPGNAESKVLVEVENACMVANGQPTQASSVPSVTTVQPPTPSTTSRSQFFDLDVNISDAKILRDYPYGNNPLGASSVYLYLCTQADISNPTNSRQYPNQLDFEVVEPDGAVGYAQEPYSASTVPLNSRLRFSALVPGGHASGTLCFPIHSSSGTFSVNYSPYGYKIFGGPSQSFSFTFS